MVLSPQTSRAVKLLTIGATAFTGYYCVFRTDYGDADHVFSDLQRWYGAAVDGLLGIDTRLVEAERMRRLEQRRERDVAARARVEEAARRLGDRAGRSARREGAEARRTEPDGGGGGPPGAMTNGTMK